jgi:hypothetical protein
MDEVAVIQEVIATGDGQRFIAPRGSGAER